MDHTKKRFFSISGSSVFTRIFYLIREWQISNRFIVIDVGTDLTVWESTFLLEIDSEEHCSAKDLSQMFDLDKSTVSRRLSGIEEKGYLRTEISKEDSRVRRLVVSGKGKSYLRRYARIVHGIMEDQFKDFTDDEKKRFLEYCIHFNDRCGVSVRRLQSSEDDPIRIEMRRFVRSLGVMKLGFMGSDLSNSQWHVLCDIYFGQAGESVQSIASSFHAPLSSLSNMLKLLEKKGYVVRAQSDTDSRRLSLAVTSEGEKALLSIEDAGSALVQNALGDLRDEELEDYVKLLIKVSGVEAPDFRLPFSVVHFYSNEQRQNARTFLIEQSLLARTHMYLPETLISAKSFCLVLVKKTEILAVAEFNLEASAVTLDNVAFSVSNPDAEVFSQFLNVAKSRALQYFNRFRHGCSARVNCWLCLLLGNPCHVIHDKH